MEEIQLHPKSKNKWIQQGKWYAPYYQEQETILEQNAETPFLHFASFDRQRWLQLAFSTRLGGVSSGALASMNLGWDRGEPRENVCENFRRICHTLQADETRLVLSDQVHGMVVQYVTESACGGAQIEKKLQKTDGMLTDIPGLVLATSYADCVPLFFCDPVRRMIASSHAGWRGTVGEIGRETVRQMKARGCRAENIHVLIGPSICQDCYEVSEDVAGRFAEAFGTETDNALAQILRRGRVTETGEQKYQLDLWAANWISLKNAGIPPAQISLSGVCTCCHAKLLFSHRASHGRRGNLNGFLRILP